MRGRANQKQCQSDHYWLVRRGGTCRECGKVFPRNFGNPRTRRDTESPRVSYRAVPLPRFRREVVALLMAGRTGSQRLDSTKALRLVIRWDRMVRLRHSQGKPPCNVADHILKYERDQAVCPCGNPLPSPLANQSTASRDKERGACRCRSRQGRGSRRDPGNRLMLTAGGPEDHYRSQAKKYRGPWLVQVRERHSEKWRTVGEFDHFFDAQSLKRERLESQCKIVRPRKKGGRRG